MSAQKTYTLDLGLDDVNTILRALGKMPFEDVYALIHTIHSQVSTQNQVADSQQPADTQS